MPTWWILRAAECTFGERGFNDRIRLTMILLVGLAGLCIFGEGGFERADRIRLTMILPVGGFGVVTSDVDFSFLDGCDINPRTAASKGGERDSLSVWTFRLAKRVKKPLQPTRHRKHTNSWPGDKVPPRCLRLIRDFCSMQQYRRKNFSQETKMSLGNQLSMITWSMMR